MRAGLLVTSYTPQVGLSAGGHVHFIEVARRWHDVDVTVFAPEEARDEIHRALPAAAFVAIPELWTPHWRLARVARMFGALSLRRELRSMDVLLATSHFIADVIPAVFARPDRTIVTLHHLLGLPGERQGPFFTNLLAWLSQFVSLCIARVFVKRFIFVCSYVAELSRGFVGDALWFVSTNGVSAKGEQQAQGVDRKDGIYFGRLDPLKRVEDAIEAWSLLPAELAHHRLHIAGDGSARYRDFLINKVQSSGLQDRVIFHGRVDDDTKWKLMRECAVYVFPSSEEGWGISVAEAMWAGLPCITYDLPVFQDVFTKGRLEAPLGNVKRLSEACATVLADEQRRAELSSEAEELALTFSWDRAAAIEREALRF